MPILNNPGDKSHPNLLSAISAVVTGAPLDCRHVGPEAYLWYRQAITGNKGESAVFNVETSHDKTAWMVIATYTATATLTGTAQHVGYFPYVRANVINVWTPTGAGGSATGSVDVHWSPRIG